MLSALQIIGSMDDAFARVQQQTGDLHGQMTALSERLLQIRKQEGDAYRRLARVRLGLGDDDPLIRTLEQLDTNVRLARQRRDNASAELAAEIKALEAEAQGLQVKRVAAADVVTQRRAGGAQLALHP